MNNWLLVLFILLPIASLTGWIIGRRSIKENANLVILNPDYLKGINYILEEKQEKAIKLFVKILDVDQGTIELHLTLGNLFRRRGEVDKAVLLHQNILAKPDLEPKQRAKVAYELGQDFMSSGLLDRAEGLFLDLINEKKLVRQSEEKLLIIYEQERDWNKAIDIACRLANKETKEYYPKIAQYYCELLEQGLSSDSNVQLDSNIQKAYAYDKYSVRARLIEGNVWLRRKQYKKAIECYLKIEKQDKAFIPLAIKSIFYCIDNLDDKKQKDKFLDLFKERNYGTTALVFLIQYLISHNQEQDVKKLLLKRLTEKPSLKILNEWVKIELNNSTDKNRESIEIIYKMLSQYLQSLPQFLCGYCGYSANVVEWQCPTCKSWGSIKPVFGISGE